MVLRYSPLAALLLLSPALAAFSQQPAQPPATGRTLTADDYAHAERWMNYNVLPLVQHTVSGVRYLPDGRVFYRDPGANGSMYMLADPAKSAPSVAFDNARVAYALRNDGGFAPDPQHLPVTGFVPDAVGGGYTVNTAAGNVHCTAGGDCTRAVPTPEAKPAQPQQAPNGQAPALGRSATETGGNSQMNAQPNAANAVKTPPARPARPAGRTRAPFDTSPDKKYAAFIRDNNLWVRVAATGEERQLTTDGQKDYGYATDNAGWTHSDAPIVLWSPDSKKIATFQQDQRKTGSLYLVPVTNRHPVLEEWKYPLVGDADVTMIERVVIDVDTAKVTRLKMPPDQHRSSLCDDISCRGGAGWDDVEFAPDAKTLAFLSTGRDHKDEWMRVADTETGAVKTVFHDHVPTYYESGQGRSNWHYLPTSNEFLWYSESSDYGQMYLYDLTTGKLKNQITHGDGPVTQVLRVDQKNRVIYFNATGKEKGDPYFTRYYRADFDGKHQTLLTPEDADHAVTPSADASTFVDVFSTAETPQVAVLRDNTGKVLVPLAKQDISALTATGWKPPTPITVKARDGKTPLYGFMWKPTTFDASRKYPLVDYVYPGPQEGSCGPRSFHSSERDNQALADLGFLVMCLDGMGTPLRSKSFHDAHASTPAALGEDTIPDQAAGIRELGQRYAWIDMDRVGIWGHSGGGNATVSAMFHFPELFKVGIAESGNHDNREYEDDWAERWAGLETKGPNGSSNYDSQANENYAKNLQGKLMLAHGTMDDNVPPNNTLLVVDALIKANKDFDLIMLPNQHHGYAEAGQYMMRRRWDYFVKYLAGNVPPVNYAVKPFDDTQRVIYEYGPSDGANDPDELF